MLTVKVRLRKPNRVFTFLNRDIPLERNDTCIVRSDRGLEYGVCVLPSEPCGKEAEERFKMTVVRKTTHHDDTTFEEIVEDENRAAKICVQRIQARSLSMKLVEVEYTFDRRRVIFYFTAEERVDFRELVRDLARELKVRIELRHIQVRDEARMIGGIGTCGRELCCTTWLRDFAPISMKMAKRQNLSLNPSKISGQCGRLMCCLSYENDQYTKGKKAWAKAPAVDAVELAKIRDQMEENAEQTARTGSKDATAPGVAEQGRLRPKTGGRKNRFRSRKREPRGTAASKSERADSPKTQRPPAAQAAHDASGQSTGAKALPDRPRRRRRRRKRSGSQTSGPNSPGPSS